MELLGREAGPAGPRSPSRLSFGQPRRGSELAAALFWVPVRGESQSPMAPEYPPAAALRADLIDDVYFTRKALREMQE